MIGKGKELYHKCGYSRSKDGKESRRKNILVIIDMIKEKLKNNKHAHELAFVKGVQMLKKNRRDSEIDNDEKTTAATEVPNEIHDFGSQLSVG
jgi:hypothetical protein